ncbi:hypothetical protein [Ralstonia syzygii]|uniref:Uncharacterized protein n=1 Tax=Ralstonia syzygii R24 TaxID=907261 RepID=G3A8L3_9RALS|nr:hypothetical protein [Ralstonia syzygii]CCA87589.1 hypothetical protein RALSY_mp10104 [Ralstonia syzygii R24]
MKSHNICNTLLADADCPRLNSVSPDDVFRRTTREIFPSMPGGQDEMLAHPVHGSAAG